MQRKKRVQPDDMKSFLHLHFLHLFSSSKQGQRVTHTNILSYLPPYEKQLDSGIHLVFKGMEGDNVLGEFQEKYIVQDLDNLKSHYHLKPRNLPIIDKHSSTNQRAHAQSIKKNQTHPTCIDRKRNTAEYKLTEAKIHLGFNPTTTITQQKTLIT